MGMEVVMPEMSDVLKSALSLRAEERAVLAEKLLASLDDLDEEEAERLWAEEAARRRAEFHAGRADVVEASKVAQKAERLFR